MKEAVSTIAAGESVVVVDWLSVVGGLGGARNVSLVGVPGRGGPGHRAQGITSLVSDSTVAAALPWVVH